MLGHARGALRIAWLSIARPPRSPEFWDEAYEFFEERVGGFEPWEYELLSVFKETDWTGHEPLLLELIQRCDTRLTLSLLNAIEPTKSCAFVGLAGAAFAVGPSHVGKRRALHQVPIPHILRQPHRPGSAPTAYCRIRKGRFAKSRIVSRSFRPPPERFEA